MARYLLTLLLASSFVVLAQPRIAYAFSVTIDASQLAGDSGRWDILTGFDWSAQSPGDIASFNTMIKTYELSPGAYAVGYAIGINPDPAGAVGFVVDDSGALSLADSSTAAYAHLKSGNTLVLAGIPMSFTSQLSKSTLDIMGLLEWDQDVGAAATTYNLLPGSYQVGYYAGVGWVTANFTLSGSGTISFVDLQAGGYTAVTAPVGGNPANLNLKGYSVSINSKLTIEVLGLDSVADLNGSDLLAHPATLNLLPGDYQIGYQVLLSDSSSSFVGAPFTVDTQGTVQVAPALAPAVTGLGSVLNLTGVSFAVNSGLSSSNVEIAGLVTLQPSGQSGQASVLATLLPGTYAVGYQTADSSGNYLFNALDFTINSDTTVSFNPLYSKFLQAGAGVLNVSGAQIAFDFTLEQNSPNFAVPGIASYSTSAAQNVMLLPGKHGFVSNALSFDFQHQVDINASNTVTFDASLNTTLSGNGTNKITYASSLVPDQAKLAADQLLLNAAMAALGTVQAPIAADLAKLAADQALPIGNQQILNFDQSKLAADRKPLLDDAAQLNTDRLQIKADMQAMIPHRLQWLAGQSAFSKAKNIAQKDAKALAVAQTLVVSLGATQQKKPTAANKNKLDAAQASVGPLQATLAADLQSMQAAQLALNTLQTQLDQARVLLKVDRDAIHAEIAKLTADRARLKALLQQDMSQIRSDLKHLPKGAVANAALIAADQLALAADLEKLDPQVTAGQAVVDADQAVVLADQAQVSADLGKLNALSGN